VTSGPAAICARKGRDCFQLGKALEGSSTFQTAPVREDFHNGTRGCGRCCATCAGIPVAFRIVSGHGQSVVGFVRSKPVMILAMISPLRKPVASSRSGDHGNSRREQAQQSSSPGRQGGTARRRECARPDTLPPSKRGQLMRPKLPKARIGPGRLLIHAVTRKLLAPLAGAKLPPPDQLRAMPTHTTSHLATFISQFQRSVSANKAITRARRIQNRMDSTLDWPTSNC